MKYVLYKELFNELIDPSYQVLKIGIWEDEQGQEDRLLIKVMSFKAIQWLKTLDMNQNINPLLKICQKLRMIPFSELQLCMVLLRT